jgi:hypothetical protein
VIIKHDTGNSHRLLSISFIVTCTEMGGKVKIVGRVELEHPPSRYTFFVACGQRGRTPRHTILLAAFSLPQGETPARCNGRCIVSAPKTNCRTFPSCPGIRSGYRRKRIPWMAQGKPWDTKSILTNSLSTSACPCHPFSVDWVSTAFLPLPKQLHPTPIQVYQLTLCTDTTYLPACTHSMRGPTTRT